MDSKLKLQHKNKLKRPLLVKCFKCPASFEVKWNTGQGEYSKKNNWGYWTVKEENKNTYICDKDLVYMYKKNRWDYLENITDLAKRRILRTYIHEWKKKFIEI